MHKLAETRLAVAMMEQMGAIALAETPSDYFQRANLEYKRRRDITVAGLQSIPGVYCRRPEGAFYILARLPVVDAEDFAAWLLQDFYLDGATVMLAPANGFYLTPGKGRTKFALHMSSKRKTWLMPNPYLKKG